MRNLQGANVPSALQRRFEAVVIVGPGLVPDAAGEVSALRRAGIHVGVVGRHTVDRSENGTTCAGCGALLVCDAHAIDLVVVDEFGIRTRHPRAGVPDAALARAGATTVERLREFGIGVRTDGSDAGAVTIDLVPPPNTEPTDLAELLSARGISEARVLELAHGAALEAGLSEPRVSFDGVWRLVIALADQLDATERILAELWRRGIGSSNVLVLTSSLPVAWNESDRALASDANCATTIRFGDQSTAFSPHDVLADQLRRRAIREVATPVPEPGWGIVLEELDHERPPAREALCALADGVLGTSGATLASSSGAHRWVVAAGLYDGDGPDSHLLTAPVAFHLPVPKPAGAASRTVLDLRTGNLYEDMTVDNGGYRSIRFSSLARPATVALRASTEQRIVGGSVLLPPAESDVMDADVMGVVPWMRVASSTGGIVAAAAEVHDVSDAGSAPNIVDRIVAYHPDPNALPDPGVAVDRLHAALSVGFDGLLNEHRREWAARWEDADVVIEGDDDLQLATRFALFHLMSAAADRGEAAVGARGLSGPGYRGHVFWDADTFVLPFLAATRPASARAMLEYRIRRLPAAMAAARSTGRAGARFPWESARTGHDVTPTSAKDLTGRVVPIRTGQLEEHIVAQVAWAASCYEDWTGDAEFAAGPGLGLLVETARYWASRIRRERDGTAHIYGVIGPDEYHEPVDDNAFTNVIARWNLRRAASEVEASDGDHDVRASEQAHWLELAEDLVDGFDANTGIYEQFSGYSRLEPLIIAEVAPRRPIAADLLLGIERVRQSQVIKQADVLMLHHMIPEEVADTLEPNLRFYEPRTAHGSSLSPAIHAGLFARARDFDPALEALRIASRIDLDDLTGTTAGGLHLATMGGLWQALALGFAGLRPRGGVLHLDPRVPPAWSALDLRVRFRESRLRLRCEPTRLYLRADKPAAVAIDQEIFTVTPSGMEFRRRGPGWEVTS